MAAIDNTSLAATIDEVWDHSVLDAKYATAVIMPRVMNKSGLVEKSGDIIHLPIQKKVVVGSVSAAGVFTPDAQTLTQVDLTVNTWKYVAEETLDQAEAQSFYSPESDFPTRAGKGLAVDYDTALAALYSDITTNVVGSEANPSTFDDTPLLAAMQKVEDSNIDIEGNMSWILPPIAFYGGLYKLDRFTDADKTGLPKSVLTSGFRTQLLGIPAYRATSTILTTVNSNCLKAFLLHKETFAIGMSIKNKFKRAERTAGLVLSTVCVMQSLYGVKTVREDHSCLLNIKNS